VQGHIDCVGVVRRVAGAVSSREVAMALPARFAKHIALHGSIAVNGVSLTVARKSGSVITVALIPYTMRNTDLGTVSVGDVVNIEVDRSVPLLKKSQRDRVSRNAKEKNFEKNEPPLDAAKLKVGVVVADSTASYSCDAGRCAPSASGVPRQTVEYTGSARLWQF